MPSTTEGDAMCCQRLIGHLQSKQAETGHVAATPAAGLSQNPESALVEILRHQAKRLSVLNRMELAQLIRTDVENECE